MRASWLSADLLLLAPYYKVHRKTGDLMWEHSRGSPPLDSRQQVWGGGEVEDASNIQQTTKRKKEKKETNISQCESDTRQQKTQTMMYREFVVIRVDTGLCLLPPAAPPLAWMMQGIGCCFEGVCAENLPLRCVCVKGKLRVNSPANSLDFIRRSCLKTPRLLSL